MQLCTRKRPKYARKPQNMHNYACKNVINKHYQSEVGTGKIKK